MLYRKSASQQGLRGTAPAVSFLPGTLHSDSDHNIEGRDSVTLNKAHMKEFHHLNRLGNTF